MGHWLSHFKTSTMVVIPKSNKIIFNFPKLYQPSILLNIIGKLFEKIIEECLQLHTISNSFIHSSQLGGLKLRSTIDVEVALTHIICSDSAIFPLSELPTFPPHSKQGGT